ncbi:MULTISPECIES: multicopper oxidase domain-containing protein [Kitasatospora]|uniref:Putative multicopper oxidase n=1 Tax=Kitasatospora setae (strain ATCC 33774 / DSM 43861 / JCM 3304 / KCC A-0304 / NBRC 14216 / KM-6054) TaxID=452652 RepID=E4N911_KITSK|nr:MULTISPECIES: multicopper oxidase domain-containing protein [Kitasatospora]BAJ27692.1 putative multicopper oxidase [Kitasatospora setae KM-6054]
MGDNHAISRRSVLRTVAAAGLASAVGARTAAAAPAPAAFPQPVTVRRRPAPERVPSVLEQVLDVRYAEVEVPGHGRVTVRAYNGAFPGPTLRVRAGDTLLLTHVNGLPPNPVHPAHPAHPAGNSHGARMPHRPHSFNLHAHGMHVSPAGLADNVLREFAPRAAPGDPEPRYRTVLRVPADHPAGTYWYHPHLHGSTAEQLAGGMAGVIVVEGDVDEVPEVRAAADVVLCVNELKLRDGRVPPFDAGAWLAGVPSVFTVNGAVGPVLALRPGEVQRWRLVAATGFTALNLRLTGPEGQLTMHRIAQDGITLPAPVPAEEVPLVMGNRVDVLVRGGAPGRYELRADRVARPLLTVEVAGAPYDPPMTLPRTLPPGRPPLDERDVTGPDREVLFHVDPGVFPQPFPDAFRVLGTHPTPPAHPGGDLRRDPAYGLYDPDYVNHVLPLGRTERWTVRTGETSPGFNHPFHLHTNPFLVTHRNGRPLDPPVWHDTVGLAGGTPGDSVTFLVRYEDFTGHALAHCHHLHHEDLGMMQNVRYVAP